MGHNLQDTFTTRMQNILRIAHDLREATAASNSPSHSPFMTSDPHVVIDSINLPSPNPCSLLHSLHEAGVSSEIASAASQIYQRRAEQLRQCIQESITTACRKAAGFPALTSALSPDLVMKKLTSIFTETYVQRLEEWKEESIRRIKQASRTPVEAVPRNSRTFNHEYVPLLEHFFEENPFPTHADKVFLAKKSNMQYRQIHVWFQNRRTRTKREGKTLRRKPTYQGATKPLDKLYERMRGHMVNSDFQAPEPSKMGLSEGPTEIEVAQNNMSKGLFASFSPPHAFPSSYPPTCHYDPFPCKSGPVCFSRPQWRRIPYGKPSPPLSINIDELVGRFSLLNVRDEKRFEGSPKLQSLAAIAAITVIPSRAPHPSLVVCTHLQPINIAQQPYPLVRALPSRSKAFQSPSPTSQPITLVPLSIPANYPESAVKRKTAPLPQRFSGRMRNIRRDTTPSESSLTSSSSSRLFSTDSESRYYSPSVSSLSTPSDVASIQELPHSFRSPCRSPFDSPIHLRGLGNTVAISSVS